MAWRVKRGGKSHLVLLSPNFHEVRTNKSFALKLAHKFHLENDLISLKHPVHEGMPSSRNALIALARKYPRSRGSTLSLSSRFTFNYFRPCASICRVCESDDFMETLFFRRAASEGVTRPSPRIVSNPF